MFVDLQVVDKWDGVTPRIVGGGDRVLIGLQDFGTRGSGQSAPAGK
jgi:hypothetical protein